MYKAKDKSFGHRALADDELLITSDTIVLIPDMDLVLGKPSDRSDAIAMLESLSGRKHVVETGVCIRTNRKCVSFTAFSDVYFKPLTREEIEYYVCLVYQSAAADEEESGEVVGTPIVKEQNREGECVERVPEYHKHRQRP
mgnify:CR=1 FL=1